MLSRENENIDSFLIYLKRIFSSRLLTNKGWPEWFGGLSLGVLNVLFLALAHKPYTIYGGFENWGRHLYNLFGLMEVKEIFLANKTSVGDIGLFLGALLVAVAAGEFKIRKGFLRDYIEGGIGGILMAIGVVLSWGCNWGGFFSAIIPLSLHGFGMFIGLIIGGYLGLLYVRWRTEKEFERIIEVPLEVREAAMIDGSKINIPYYFRMLFTLSIIILFSLAILFGPDGGTYFGMMLLGLLVGIVIQRSRFCFATAFRELFGGVEMSRAIRLQLGIALGIVIGATGAAILKYMGYVDTGIYVKYISYSNVVGGIIFGFGMSIAGACASGSLWKAAEGNLKILIALIAAILSYPFLKLLRDPIVEAINPTKVFLPDVFGWGGSLILIYFIMLVWVLTILYYGYRKGVRVYG